MEPVFALLLIPFFGVFHIIGGLAVGQGFRTALKGENAIPLFIWGAGMGVLPLLFDWFFLIAQGYLVHGLIGPLLFLLAAFGAAFLQDKVDGPAVISTVLGLAGVMMGILAIPLMLGRAREYDLGMEDYIGGSCFVLMFVVVGGAFALSGLGVLVRGISPAHQLSQRQQKAPGPRKHSKDPGKERP